MTGKGNKLIQQLETQNEAKNEQKPLSKAIYPILALFAGVCFGFANFVMSLSYGASNLQFVMVYPQSLGFVLFYILFHFIMGTINKSKGKSFHTYSNIFNPDRTLKKENVFYLSMRFVMLITNSITFFFLFKTSQMA